MNAPEHITDLDRDAATRIAIATGRAVYICLVRTKHNSAYSRTIELPAVVLSSYPRPDAEVVEEIRVGEVY